VSRAVPLFFRPFFRFGLMLDVAFGSLPSFFVVPLPDDGEKRFFRQEQVSPMACFSFFFWLPGGVPATPFPLFLRGDLSFPLGRVRRERWGPPFPLQTPVGQAFLHSFLFRGHSSVSLFSQPSSVSEYGRRVLSFSFSDRVPPFFFSPPSLPLGPVAPRLLPFCRPRTT